MRRIRTRVLLALAVATLLSIGSAGTTYAADNTATGDIAGDSADLANSNVFTLNTTTLSIVKTAFLTTGAQLTSGASLPRGTQVQFMVYVDNSTGVTVSDVNIQDVLDVTFAYQTTSIRVDNSVASGATEAAIYAAVSVAPLLDDGVDLTDVAGITGTTLSAGSSAGNTQLDVAPTTVWAMLFTVEMQ